MSHYRGQQMRNGGVIIIIIIQHLHLRLAALVGNPSMIQEEDEEDETINWIRKVSFNGRNEEERL